MVISARIAPKPMPPPPLTEATLLQHAGFVRALATSLLRDPDRADDVVQETFVRALEQPPRDAGRLRSWLARIAERLAWRTRRSDSRRARRELRAARPEVERVDEERATVLASVTAAVLGLREPYRSTVLACYYEGRSARDVAQGEGISLHTVHARLRRAREQLRTQLDHDVRGGRAAWMAGLSALTGAPLPIGATPLPSPGDAPATRFGNLFAVSTNTKLAAVSGFLLILLGAFALPVFLAPAAARPADPIAEPEATALTAHAPSGATIDRERTPLVAPTQPNPSRASDLPATRGSLRLVATFARDGSPAVGRTFRVLAFDDPNPLRTARAVCTDAAGEARIDDLTPGTILLYGDVGGGGSVKVAAGEEVTVAIVIPVGIELRGRVVDARAVGVAGATVWLSDYGNEEDGNVVGTTDARGAFRVPEVGDGRSVCAFAGGHAPARLARVVGEPGRPVDMTLVLGPRGARLAGEVVDAAGVAVAEAEVRVEFRAAGHVLQDRALAPRVGRTDTRGTFAFDGLAPGTATLLVRPRERLAPRALEVELLEGGSRALTVELTARGSVAGVVRDDAGRPVTRAEIRQGDHAGFLSSLTRSGPDGRFVLDALPLGDVDLRVEKKGEGKAAATLHVTSGIEVEWSPTLLRGLVYRARILDDHREPRAGWDIYALASELEGPGRTLWSRSAKSGADGRFEITGCPEGELRLELRAPVYTAVPIVVHVARASTLEDTIVITADDLPTSSLAGSVVDAHGRPVGGKLTARPAGRAHAYEAFVDATSGHYELTAMIRGNYTVTFTAPDLPTVLVARLTLAAATREDLGVLRLTPPGHLRVAVSGQAGVRAPIDELRIRGPLPADDRAGTTEKAMSRVVAAGTLDPIALHPGRYEVAARGAQMLAETHTVEVVAGEATELALDPRPGEACSFVLAGGPDAPRIATLVARDDAGQLVASWSSLRPGDEQWATEQRLPTGRLRLTVHDATPSAPRDAAGAARACGELEFTVPAGGGRWRVELR